MVAKPISHLIKATSMNKSSKIKTNIKFSKGLENAPERLYGFVTKKEGKWRGCHADEPKKKVVFVDPQITPEIVPNALYHCSLIRMQSDTGFIAKTAKLVTFEAEIAVVCNDDLQTFSVKVRFGNKEMVYNPASREKRMRDIKAIATTLRQRIDLQNALQVAEEFIDHAVVVRRLYNEYLKSTSKV